MSPDANDSIVIIAGPRGDFEELIKLLSHEAFVYEPRGLAAARAYDCIREALEAEQEIEDADEPEPAGEADLGDTNPYDGFPV